MCCARPPPMCSTIRPTSPRCRIARTRQHRHHAYL
jgi:hypothetical protein